MSNGERRHDWDRTVIRVGGADKSVTQLVWGCLLLLVAGGLALLGLRWQPAYAGAVIVGIYGALTLLS